MKGFASLAYGLILFRLRKVEEYYGTAGKLYLAFAVFSVLMIPIQAILLTSEDPSLDVFSTIASLFALILSLVGTYYEFAAHSYVSKGADRYMSKEWDQLWKCYIGLMIGLIFATFLTLLSSWFVIALFCVVIGIAIASIMKLALLYQTAKLF